MELTGKYALLDNFHFEKVECGTGLVKQFGYFFGTCNGNGTLNILLDTTYSEEEYSILIGEDQITIKASSQNGFFYALMTLQQLADGNKIPCGTVKDRPKLKMRGFHFKLGSMKQMGFKDVMRIIEMMGKFKLNTLLLEYTDKFPFKKHPALCASNAFTEEQVKEIEDFAAANYIDIIPLVQSLGHFEYVTEKPAYKHLAELEGNGQLCPAKQETVELIKDLLDEVMQTHPKSRYFHIGGDETRALGCCPECRKTAENNGKSAVYLRHINKIIMEVKNKGRIPIIWDDMVSRHPEVIKELDHDAIIMYWDYWTTSSKSPILVARAAGYGIVHDKRWNNEWYAELQEPEKTIVAKFSQGIDFTKDLGNDYLNIFGKYLGPDFPKHVTPFPNIHFFNDNGFTLIGAPTTLGNRIDDTFGLPNYNRFLGNIREFANACINKNTLGLVTTAWYNFPPEILDLGILASAQFAWNGGTGQQ